MFKWKRVDERGYECSSAGDKRFSAFFAKLKDGRTIEEAYQLDVKGYRGFKTIREAKGNPPLLDKDQDVLYSEYRVLWDLWAMQNPELILELKTLAKNGILTDKFANTPVNQARALSEIINEKFFKSEDLFGEWLVVRAKEPVLSKRMRSLILVGYKHSQGEESCGNCLFYRRHYYNENYKRCEKNDCSIQSRFICDLWTSNGGTVKTYGN